MEPEVQVQRCGRCKETLPSDLFNPSRRGRDGFWCKPCARAERRGEPPKKATHDAYTCEQCGKKYVPRQIKKNNFFCSRTCKERHQVESGRVRETHLQRKYGIGAADYDRILAEQNGGCALCGVKPEELKSGRYRTYLHVDHCHETGRVRGLLCPDHNLLLGRFGDSVDVFRRVVAYLEAAEART